MLCVQHQTQTDTQFDGHSVPIRHCITRIVANHTRPVKVLARGSGRSFISFNKRGLLVIYVRIDTGKSATVR